MIKINLLPQELQKGKKDRTPSAAAKAPVSGMPLVVGVLILAFVAAGFTGYKVIGKKVREDRAVRALTNERDAKKKEVESKQQEFKELMELKTLLENQIEILNALDPPHRLLWSEKINMIAEVIPKNVFVTNLKMTELVQEEETNESKMRRETWTKAGAKGTPPPTIKKPKITQTLVISGITWADDPEQRLALILKFHDAMKEHTMPGFDGKPRRFMDNFKDQIRIEPTWVDRMAGRAVNRFKLVLVTEPMMSDQ